MSHQNDGFGHLFIGAVFEREERPRAPERRPRPDWWRGLSFAIGWLNRRISPFRRR